jgi:hypothetical protein
MKKNTRIEKQFAICIDNSGYPASLELFVSVELPQQVRQSWVRRVRESTMLADKTLQATSRAQRKAKGQKILAPLAVER